jgi:hypothetical protein
MATCFLDYKKVAKYNPLRHYATQLLLNLSLGNIVKHYYRS